MRENETLSLIDPETTREAGRMAARAHPEHSLPQLCRLAAAAVTALVPPRSAFAPPASAAAQMIPGGIGLAFRAGTAEIALDFHPVIGHLIDDKSIRVFPL